MLYGWLREKYDMGELKKMPKDICSLRGLFYSECGNKINTAGKCNK